MRTFDDLMDREKEKFIAYQLLRNKFNTDSVYNTLYLFIYLIITLVPIGLIMMFCFHLIYIGMLFNSEELVLAMSEILMFLPFVSVILIIIFFILYILQGYINQRNKKVMYALFGISNASEQIFNIKKDDLKNINLPKRKKLCYQKKHLKKEEH